MNNLVQCIDCGRWRLEDGKPHITRTQNLLSLKRGFEIAEFDCAGRPQNIAAKGWDDEERKLYEAEDE